MTTGSRGLHIVVPLTGREDLDQVREFARNVADTLADAHPDRLTTAARKKDRRWTIADAVEQARTDPWAGLKGRGRALGPARRRLDALNGSGLSGACRATRPPRWSSSARAIPTSNCASTARCRRTASSRRRSERVGLIGAVLSLPFAPVRGSAWVIGQVLTEAERRHLDPTAVRAELAALERVLTTSEISEEEFERREDELLDRLETGLRTGWTPERGKGATEGVVRGREDAVAQEGEEEYQGNEDDGENGGSPR